MMDDRINTKRHLYEALEPTRAEVGEVYELMAYGRGSSSMPYASNNVTAVRVLDIDDEYITLGELPKESSETDSPFGQNRGYSEFYDCFRLDAEEGASKEELPVGKRVVDEEATAEAQKKIDDSFDVKVVAMEKDAEALKAFNAKVLKSKMELVEEVSKKYDYPTEELAVVKKALEYMYGEAMDSKLPKKDASPEELYRSFSREHVKYEYRGPINCLYSYKSTWEGMFSIRNGISKAGKKYTIYTTSGDWSGESGKKIGPFTSKLLEILAPSVKDGFKASTDPKKSYAAGTNADSFILDVKRGEIGNSKVYKTVTDTIEVEHPAYTKVFKVPATVDGSKQNVGENWVGNTTKFDTINVDGYDRAILKLSASMNAKRSKWTRDYRSELGWEPPILRLQTGFYDSTD